MPRQTPSPAWATAAGSRLKLEKGQPGPAKDLTNSIAENAKSGDAAMIAGYCGTSAALDEAIGRFALAYSKQTEKDHAALQKARLTGRIKVAANVVR